MEEAGATATRASAAGAELRERILVQMTRLIHDYGYAKATVADVASALEMSPGNIYRVFASKQELMEAAADRMLEGVRQKAREIVEDRASTPGRRLRRLILSFQRSNQETFTQERRAHEMVAVAIRENWPPVERHIKEAYEFVGRLIEEGAQTGAFQVADPVVAAQCVRVAITSHQNPLSMQQRSADTPPTLEQMINFILASLGAREKPSCAPVLGRN